MYLKRYVRSSEFSGNKRLDYYIDKVKRMVNLDLDSEYVASAEWDMEDDKVLLNLTFVNGDEHLFTFDTWRFTMMEGYVGEDADIILRAVDDYIRDSGMSTDESTWELLEKKSVLDYDGFYTDYTLWYNTAEDYYVCIFGDSDLYTPETAEFDAEFETERGAYEWFDSYAEDDIVEESTRIRASQESDEFVNMGTGLNYWYFTTHGVMPGSVPKGLNIIKIIDKPEGTYFLTDRVLTTKSLKYYDIKERSPKGINAYFDPIEDIDASDSIGPLESGDRFKNRAGVIVTITDSTKDGRIQYMIGEDCRVGSERSIQKMLYRNNYIRI